MSLEAQKLLWLLQQFRGTAKILIFKRKTTLISRYKQNTSREQWGFIKSYDLLVLCHLRQLGSFGPIWLVPLKETHPLDLLEHGLGGQFCSIKPFKIF